MNTCINLMTRQMATRCLVRRRCRLWAFTAALGIGVLGLVGWGQSIRVSQAAAQRHLLEEQYRPVQHLKTRIGDTRKRLKELVDQEQVALRLCRQKLPLGLLTALSSAAATTRGDVFIVSLQYQRDEPKVDGDSVQVVVRGIGIDDTAIAAFVGNLRRDTRLEQVKLQSTSARQIHDRVVREFQLQCVY